MTTLRIRSSYRTVFVHGRRAGIPMPHERENSLSKKNLFYGLVVTLFLTYKVVCSVYSLFTIKLFEVRLYVLASLCYISTGIFIVLFFTIYRSRFVTMLERFDELTESLLNSGFGHEEVLVESYNTAASFVKKFAKVMSIVSVVYPTIFCLSGPFFDFLEGHYRSRAAIPGQCPMELVVQGLPGVFELIAIQQALGYFYPCTQRYIIDGVMLAFFRTQSSYFKYLSKTLEDIGREVKLKGSASENFLKWIKLHQQVTINAHELSFFFSPVIVMYYVSTIIAFAGSLIHMMDSKSVNFLQSFFGIMGVLTALGQLYLQCHVAHDITTQGENMSFPVYNMPWTEYSHKARDSVRLIITAANHPIYIEAYRCPTLRLDRVTCQALFLNFVSTFMAFRKIKAMNDPEDGAAE